jgi:hypothetical protein
MRVWWFSCLGFIWELYYYSCFLVVCGFKNVLYQERAVSESFFFIISIVIIVNTHALLCDPSEIEIATNTFRIWILHSRKLQWRVSLIQYYQLDAVRSPQFRFFCVMLIYMPRFCKFNVPGTGKTKSHCFIIAFRNNLRHCRLCQHSQMLLWKKF